MEPDHQETSEQALSPLRPLALNGRTYLCRPPVPSIIAGIQSFIRRRIEKVTPLSVLVNDPAFAKLPPEIQASCARIAAEAQVRGTRPLDGLALFDAMAEPPALAFAIWLNCREQHPGLALEEIQKAITEDNAAEVLANFIEAGGMTPTEKNQAGPPPSIPEWTGGPWSEASATVSSPR